MGEMLWGPVSVDMLWSCKHAIASCRTKLRVTGQNLSAAQGIGISWPIPAISREQQTVLLDALIESWLVQILNYLRLYGRAASDRWTSNTVTYIGYERN